MKQNNVSTLNNSNIYFLILFLVIFVKVLAEHLFYSRFNILAWPDVSYIPLIQAIGNPHGLFNDSYISSALESPNLIFVYLISFLSNFGIDVIYLFLFLKLALILFTPLIVLKFCFLFSSKISTLLSISTEAERVQRFLIFLGIIFLSNFFYFYKFLSLSLILSGISDNNMSFFMPFGWDDPLSHHFVAPSTIAFICGICFNIKALIHNKKFSYSAIFILAFTTLLHPVVGIGHFIIGFIISLSLGTFTSSLFIYLRYGIASIFLPVLILLTFFGSENTVNVYDFIETYVYLRHPHHYQMSSILGWGSIFWSLVLVFNLFISIISKSKYLIILNLCIFFFISMSVFVQFLGTELYPIQKIVELGPSRFSQYIFILCLLITVFNFIYLAEVKGYFENYAKPKLASISVPNNILYFSYSIIFCFSLFYFNNLKFDSYEDRDKDLIMWINKNTDKNSVFFVPAVDNYKSGHPLSFVIRIFAERSIWVDRAYPFNHDVSKIWGSRYAIYKDFHLKENSKKHICLDLRNQVDYLVLSLDSILVDSRAIYTSKNWKVLKIESVASKFCKTDAAIT